MYKQEKTNKSGSKTEASINFWQEIIPQRYRKTVLFLCLWTITLSWWSKFKNYKFVQDDLLLFPYFQDEKLSAMYKIFGGAEVSHRWRPFTNLFTYLATELIGTNHVLWFTLNVTLIALSGFLLGVLIWRKTNYFSLSLLVVCAFVTSRFQTGLVTQATFIVENISNLLFVILLGILVSKLPFSYSDIFKISAVFTALILTHERYVTIGLPIVIALLLKTKNSRKKLIGVLINTMIVLIFFLVKKYVLLIPLFVGTGSAWNVGFSIQGFLTHTKELILGIFGINYGPPYLNGYVIQIQGLFETIISVTIFIACLARIWNGAFYSLTLGNSKERLMKSLFPVSLFLALAIPVVSTIRIEQRWFITPYIAFLYYLIPSVASKTKARQSLPIYAALILSVVMNFSYLKNSDGIYFNQTSLIAEDNSELFFEALEKTSESAAEVAIISSEDTKVFDLWYKNFFEINFPGTPFNPRYYASLAEAKRYSNKYAILELKSDRLSNLRKDFGKEGYLLSGNYWLDGWAGKNFSITTSNQVCRAIKVNFLGSIFKNSVQISDARGIRRSLDKLKNPGTIVLKVKDSFEVFNFDFKRVYIPKKLGINADVRSLATRMSFRCQQ
jgi:hypothetical protein